MNYIMIMISVCIISHQNNLFSSDDDINQKLSIEYTRAEKIMRHLTKEVQILEKEIKSKRTDYQPTLDEIKHEISLLEAIIHSNPEFHDDVAKNIQNGQAYLKWFSLDYVRKRIKDETEKYHKDIAKKAAKKISLEKQKSKRKNVSNKSQSIETIYEETILQENIVIPEIIETQLPEIQQVIDQTPLPVHNEQDRIQTPWYYPCQLYKKLQDFTYEISQSVMNGIKLMLNISS